jgi:ligand-binding sensor domain-containing protein/serine phosphatase RsbU (regulator of sigma subunit)
MKTQSKRTTLLAVVIVVTFAAEHRIATAQSSVDNQRGALYEIKPEPATLRPRLRFQILDRKRGLAQDTVSAIAQDLTGFVWLGTADGLARYDGQRFRVFRNVRDNSSTISSSFISTLLMAKDGTLWIGTTGGGVNRYLPDTESFERFVATEDADTLDDGTILAMDEGPDGRIWIGTNGAGLAVLDPGSGKVQSFAEDNGLPPVVTAIFAGEAIWVGTAAGVYRFDPKAKNAERMFANQTELGGVITGLVEDSRGDLWIGTDGSGLVRYSPKSMKIKTFQANPEDQAALYEGAIRAVIEDRSGRLWVGTDNAIHILDPDSGRFTRDLVDRDTAGALPGRTAALFQDAAGMIWIGTADQGAAMLDPLSLRFSYYATKNTSGMFRKGDVMWVVTATGACRWQGKDSFEGVCYPTGFSTSALVDRHGTVWIGTWAEGLFRLDPESTDRWVVYEHDPGDSESLAPGPVARLYEDRAGNLWVGTIGGGVQRFDRRRNAFVLANAIPSNQIYNIKGDPKRDDILWVSTADQGFMSMDMGSGKLEIFLPEPDDPSNRTDNSVVDFVFDGDDTMWLATYGGGLKRFDRKSKEFKSYRRAEGMPSETVYAVVQDKSGRLWASSIAGLARFDPTTERVHVFTEADGLQSDEFILLSGQDLGDGRFFFGGTNGFNLFDPETVEIDEFSPPVVLTSIKILGEVYRPGKRVEALKNLALDHDESFVEIEFASLSFSASRRLSFEYKVKGLNEKWFSAQTASVSLPGLKDGDYTMLLRARNRHGVESEPTSIAIVVNPPLWRTWWAYTLYVTAAVALVLVLLRRQQRRAKAKIEAVEKEARLAFAERELELTAAVQTGFLPVVNTVRDDCFSLFGYYDAADQCSGDWWWHEKLSDRKHLVLVGDVTGHGAAPAMVTASVSTTFRVLRHIWKESGAVEFLRAANQQVLNSGRGDYLMQLMAAELDIGTGELSLYSAAGLPAICLLGGKRKMVIARGTPLGSPDFEVGHATLNLSPGDRFMLLTDGIVEIERPDGRPWGLERVGRAYEEVATAPLAAATEHIVAAARQLNSDQKQKDDWTFVISEFNPPTDYDARTAVRT